MVLKSAQGRASLLLYLILSGIFVGQAQQKLPDSNKNPVKAMFFQRYLNLRNFGPAINYKTKTLLFKKYRTYVSPLNKKGWTLTFEDNFDSINKRKWRLGQPWGYFHEGSLHQYYEENDLIVKNGCLNLLGKYDPKTFMREDTSITIPYSVGLINSDISFMQKYGYFEIRSKNPRGPATWPAFWLTGAHHWPPEIDIFEMYGKRSGKSVHKRVSTIHFGVTGTRSMASFIHKVRMPKDTDTAFHVYACKWTKRYITFYSDGILVRKQRINKRLHPFLDDEMVIIINNGFEAKYLKYLPADFKENAFVVDWVRVYKKL